MRAALLLLAALALALACGDGKATPNNSTQPALKTYRDDGLRLELQYPVAWIEGAAPKPIRPCSNCVIFGPRHATYPQGVELFVLVHAPCASDLSVCHVWSYFGIVE